MSTKAGSRIVRGRRGRQSGQELVEFGLMLTILMPLLVGSFVTGFTVIRGIQTNQMTRDMADMYIHGADFSTYPMQQMAQRLAKGLNLQIGSSFSGNNNANTGNSGDGLVTVTQIMWVGNGSCAGTCTNKNKFVFTERVKFGNGALASQTPSSLGDPGAGVVISAAGIIQNYEMDANAALPSGANAAMQALWQVNTGGRVPLVDGQVAYVVETYIQALNLNLGIYKSSGTYARYFF